MGADDVSLLDDCNITTLYHAQCWTAPAIGSEQVICYTIASIYDRFVRRIGRNMATSTAQRVGIWVIAVAMVVGTVAGFIAMILSSESDTKNQQALAKYQSEYAAYQKKAEEQTKLLSDK